MKWKKRQREIARLRREHRDTRPDLRETPRSEQRSTSYPSLTSSGVSRIVERKRAPMEPPKDMIVDTLHKQGPMVLARSELPWAGGKKS